MISQERKKNENENGRENKLAYLWKGLNQGGMRERPGDVHEAKEVHHKLVERVGVHLPLRRRHNQEVEQKERCVGTRTNQSINQRGERSQKKGRQSRRKKRKEKKGKEKRKKKRKVPLRQSAVAIL